MSFQYPIQRIRCVGEASAGRRNFLVTTAGQGIYVFDIETGSKLSSWPSNSAASDNHTANGDLVQDASEPPEKRRRLSSSLPESHGPPGTSENSEPGASDNAVSKEAQWQSIPILAVTGAGNHAVAVTTEDKCVRVFEVTHNGRLMQLSSREMPKRPSAIALTNDDSAILVADKFGDVYSIPFFVLDEPIQPSKKEQADVPKAFQPSASQLTVHTKRNLVALEQQRRYGAILSPKIGPIFRRTLLLGHVSLLTDIALVSLPPSGESAASRDYILTSDRDEHIRISRGPPQAYIIEGYCLGHTSFVSRLCVPQWDRSVLISGGGDDYILIWDWLQRRILRKVTLDEISGCQEGESVSTTGDVAVAGIWDIPFDDNTTLQAEAPGTIVVALEGVPKLLSFVYETNERIVAQPPIEIAGNALDVTAIDRSGHIFVAVDNVHEPGSTSTRRNPPSSPEQLLQEFKLVIGPHGLKWEMVSSVIVDAINQDGTAAIPARTDEKESSTQTQSLGDCLYGLTNLRKREG